MLGDEPALHPRYENTNCLAEAMAWRAVRVEEELVLSTLLADLATNT
ncbi:hypothetical protein AB0M95_30690 [Sphaerisporangium sp. NPDC051017]